MGHPRDVAVSVDSRDLSFVVNSFNRKVLLERAVASLYEHLRPAAGEILVVDDGSTDGSRELIEEWAQDGRHPGLRLVRPPQRVGFAGGVNLGFSVSSAPYVCLFETDNVIKDSNLWRGVAYLKSHPNVAGVGFQVTTLDGRRAGNSMSFPSPLGFVLGQQITARLNLERPAFGPRRDVVFTSPIVLSRDAISKVGLMNEVTFPFCDSDIDWCRRINQAGFEIHVLEDISVVHDQGDHRSEFSRRRALDFHRARLAYFKAHSPEVVPWVRVGLLGRHLTELALLGAGRVLGAVRPERLQTRVDLLKRWFRDYEDVR